MKEDSRLRQEILEEEFSTGGGWHIRDSGDSVKRVRKSSTRAQWMGWGSSRKRKRTNSPHGQRAKESRTSALGGLAWTWGVVPLENVSFGIQIERAFGRGIEGVVNMMG
jgi:hypothetical protein